MEHQKLEVPALPREVWHLVLSYLPHRHLARAILVCQDWAQAAGDPHLWKDFSLRLASEDSLGLGERLARLLNLHRFSYLRQLELAHVAASPVPLASTLSLSTHHIHLIASSSITSLRLDNCDLSDCNEESLAALLNNLNALDLEDVRWGPGQAHAVITNMAQRTKLKSLKISCPFSSQEEQGGVFLATMPPELLGSAFTKLEVLHLRMVVLSTTFWSTLFQLICVETCLKEVEFELQGVTAMSAKLFANALSKIQSVDLSQVHVRQDQVSALIDKVASGCSVRHLDLSSCDLSQIDPHTLARAVSSLKKVDVSNCGLNDRQVNSLFLALATGSTTKDLDIGQTDLSSVPPEILAAGVNSLEKAVLPRLTSGQRDRLLDEVSPNTILSTKLSMLSPRRVRTPHYNDSGFRIASWRR